MDTVIDENANTLLKPFYNIEAEMGVLGALMIEETVADDIIRKIDKSYFLNINHQAIFEAITTLLESFDKTNASESPFTGVLSNII